MKHDKKAIRTIKKVTNKKCKSKEEYFDYLRTNLLPLHYIIEKYPIFERRQWYLLVYTQENKCLLGVIKCGYFNHELFGTQDVNIYT